MTAASVQILNSTTQEKIKHRRSNMFKMWFEQNYEWTLFLNTSVCHANTYTQCIKKADFVLQKII